jgi:hypothetical protein
MPWGPGGVPWSATRCTPLAEDPKQPGDPCTVEGDIWSGIDDCDRRVQCWDVDPETNMGTCVAMCIGSEAVPSCANACEHCTIQSDALPLVCLPPCDPFAQDCGEGAGCYLDDGATAFDCIPAGTAAIGDACEYDHECAPGSHCAGAALVPGCADARRCCTAYCDVTEAEPCPATLPGTECIPFYDDRETPCLPRVVGACVLPE